MIDFNIIKNYILNERLKNSSIRDARTYPWSVNQDLFGSANMMNKIDF